MSHVLAALRIWGWRLAVGGLALIAAIASEPSCACAISLADWSASAARKTCARSDQDWLEVGPLLEQILVKCDSIAAADNSGAADGDWLQQNLRARTIFETYLKASRLAGGHPERALGQLAACLGSFDADSISDCWERLDSIVQGGFDAAIATRQFGRCAGLPTQARSELDRMSELLDQLARGLLHQSLERLQARSRQLEAQNQFARGEGERFEEEICKAIAIKAALFQSNGELEQALTGSSAKLAVASALSREYARSCASKKDG
jgi:hypothetical protein